MFVRESRYNAMLNRAVSAELSYAKLLKEWNTLVRRVNKLGGDEFLKRSSKTSQFTMEEVRSLIQLCHPDKHDGKQSATDMTKKLLKLKEDMECK